MGISIGGAFGHALARTGGWVGGWVRGADLVQVYTDENQSKGCIMFFTELFRCQPEGCAATCTTGRGTIPALPMMTADIVYSHACARRSL